jgi:hypothetical protein
MKQEVFVVGSDLRDLVPFSLTFIGPDYSVTVVEAHDVMKRATELAADHDAWFLLILSGDEDTEAYGRLETLAPSTSMVIEDGDDALIALAHLIAVASWENTEAKDLGRATIQTQETHG